jgi:hypothetical protein
MRFCFCIAGGDLIADEKSLLPHQPGKRAAGKNHVAHLLLKSVNWKVHAPKGIGGATNGRLSISFIKTRGT